MPRDPQTSSRASAAQPIHRLGGGGGAPCCVLACPELKVGEHSEEPSKKQEGAHDVSHPTMRSTPRDAWVIGSLRTGPHTFPLCPFHPFCSQL